MLEETRKKIGETFGAMKKEVGEMLEPDVVATVKGKDVEIVGPLRELRINGKLVRFPGGKP